MCPDWTAVMLFTFFIPINLYSSNSPLSGIRNWHRFSNIALKAILKVGCQRIFEPVSTLFCINHISIVMDMMAQMS